MTSDEAPPPTTVPVGWYPDPHTPPRERWWTGTEWSRYTHRPMRLTYYPPAYVHSFWPGPNRPARIARILVQCGAGFFLISLFGLIFTVAGSAFLMAGAVILFLELVVARFSH